MDGIEKTASIGLSPRCVIFSGDGLEIEPDVRLNTIVFVNVSFWVSCISFCISVTNFTFMMCGAFYMGESYVIVLRKPEIKIVSILYRFVIEWPNLVQFHDSAIPSSTKVQFLMILSFFVIFRVGDFQNSIGFCFDEKNV